MYTSTITGRCRDGQGRDYAFRFSWATDAGIEWGNLYLDDSLRPEMLGYEMLRSMESAHCDPGQEFPPQIGPAEGWNRPQMKVPDPFYSTTTDGPR